MVKSTIVYYRLGNLVSISNNSCILVSYLSRLLQLIFFYVYKLV